MGDAVNNLEAFLSDDAKNGRVWTNGRDQFRRFESADAEGCDIAQLSDDNGRTWRTIYAQVAAMEGTVTWADEPKTLTPQEALRALMDGSRLTDRDGDKEIVFSAVNKCLVWRFKNDLLPSAGTLDLSGLRIVPDPSQPAEPQVDDKVKRIPGCECHLEEGDSPCRVHGEDEEAKPQFEYPLLVGQAIGAMHHECRTIESEASKEEYRTERSGRLMSRNRIYRDWSPREGFAFSDAEITGKWRIVEGK